MQDAPSRARRADRWTLGRGFGTGAAGDETCSTIRPLPFLLSLFLTAMASKLLAMASSLVAVEMEDV